MADDIDIEEHDILENPAIKQIFPDLSILKKEIDYNDDIQEISDSESTTSINHHSKINNLIIGKSLKNRSLFNNKRILGTKRVNREENKEKAIKTKVKVLLENIKPQLIKNQRFCQRCLILFSKKEALDKHHNIYHNEMGHTEHINIETKKLNNLNFNYDKCDSNTQFSRDVIENTKNKISNVNVMVNINESDKDTIETVVCTTMKPCFHCKVLFPSQQSLIDHLYEVLYKKQLEHSPQPTKNCCERDIIKEHDEFQSTDEIKSYNKLYRCPICSYYFDVEKFYTGHLLNKHKLNKNAYIEPVTFSSKCKFCNLDYNDVISYNTHLRKRHRYEIIKKYVDNIDSSPKDREVYNLSTTTITKQILEKSSKENDDCRIKKGMSELSVIAVKGILFKCSKCNIHFLTSEAATNHFEHSKLLEQWECAYCLKIFKYKDAKLHEYQHKYSKYISVVEINNSNHSNVLAKSPACEVPFEKAAFIDHHPLSETEQPKLPDCTASKVLMDEETLISKNANKFRNHSVSDIQFTDADNSINIPEKKKEDFQHGISTTYQDNVMLNHYYFYFCKICKCSIQKGYDEIHLQPSCNNLKKYICESCGLSFSEKNIIIHRKLHKKYNSLKLHDFMFYDLNNKHKVRPIDEFSKCESCEKHFIHETEIENHKCSDNNHLTCPKCNKKFSDSAYKLHEPFHNYVITNDCEKLINGNRDHDSISCVKDNAEKSKDSFDETSYIYSCKNCDVSMNLYDEVIEHCHSHNNLNKTEVVTMKCIKCNLNFIFSSYMQHHRLHRSYTKEQFKCLEFDMLYFGCNNEQWLDHVFGALPKDVVSKIIENSIYKKESRIKMNILQTGPFQLTLHKCLKCLCFLTDQIYAHMNKCSLDSDKFYCTSCGIPFLNKLSLSQHKQHHKDYNISLKSYRIISFNEEKDRKINESIARIVKYYVLYKCRHCHVVVDKNKYKIHECNSSYPKICSKCGLLIQKRDYEMHVLKHKRVSSFNKNVMKVVLFSKNVLDKSMIIINDKKSTFTGMLYDYKLYKCVNCEVCVREFRSIGDHYCLINAAKSKCPQCDLIFDEGKLKGHLKLHDTDPDFTKDTIMIKTFGSKKRNKSEHVHIDIKTAGCKIVHSDNVKVVSKAGVGDEPLNELNVYQKPEITSKIYKCRCSLHFIDAIEMTEHLKKCSGIARNKQSKQDCFKCGLTFTRAVLFKHILKHHGDMKKEFKYEIIEAFNGVDLLE